MEGVGEDIEDGEVERRKKEGLKLGGKSVGVATYIPHHTPLAHHPSLPFSIPPLPSPTFFYILHANLPYSFPLPLFPTHSPTSTVTPFEYQTPTNKPITGRPPHNTTQSRTRTIAKRCSVSYHTTVFPQISFCLLTTAKNHDIL